MAGFALASLIPWAANYKPTAAQLLAGINDALRAAGGPRQSSPPGSPVDEDNWFLVVDATNGVEWHLKYNAADASSFKWHFISGADIYILVPADETTTSTTYVDLTTVGPSFTIPRGGDLDVWAEFDGYNATGNTLALASPKKGAAAASDNDGAKLLPNSAVGTPGGSADKSTRFTGMSASDVIKVQYRTSAGTAHFLNRVLRIRGVRLS